MAKRFLNSTVYQTPALTVVGNNTASTGDTTNVTQTDLFSRYSTLYRANNSFEYFNDFVSSSANSISNDLAVALGTGASLNSSAITDATNRVGVIQALTGTTSTSFCSLKSNNATVRLGGGIWIYEISLNVTTLSTLTDRYQELHGFFDAATANQVDGVYFLYDEGAVSTGAALSLNWQTVTCSNSTRTFTTTSTTVTAGSWVKLRITINAAASSVVFAINGTTVATHTTNIPTGSGRETGFGLMKLKSTGTTTLGTTIDYLYAQCVFTTPR